MNQGHESTIVARLDEARDFLRERCAAQPVLGFVAGSGLGALGSLIDDAQRYPYASIPHMPSVAVIGHAGELVSGTLEGLPVVVLSGRVHRYEGHPLDEVVFGVRLLARLGVQGMVLTNAAGSLNESLPPGNLCRVIDHLNLTGENPLQGPNVEALGPRFPDMSRVYRNALGDRLSSVADKVGVALAQGVYAGLRGPSYETPAEIRMLRHLGADLVGMSTVLEATALAHMGVPVAGVSVVTNLAAGVTSEILDHADVKHVADKAGPELLRLMRAFVRDLVAEPLS